MFGLARRLRDNGVLGINRRNAHYQLVYNHRRNYPLVDDKLQSKRIAQRVGITVPELYGVIEFPHQVRHLASMLAPYGDFVIKPAHGSGGDGIVVVVARVHELFREANGNLTRIEDLQFHVNNILSGTYSLGGQNDVALIEYRVQFDPVFEKTAFQGIPDIRIIVFLGVPAMAMVRLPTRMSGGRANLHQGAIGAGVDMSTGRTLTAVWRNDVVDEHPDTGSPVMGIPIPHWDTLLDLAARSYELTGLGYQGMDIVLDRDKGPMMLELNARPGLNIQIANREGLGRRLALIESAVGGLRTVEDRIAFAKQNFRPRFAP